MARWSRWLLVAGAATALAVVGGVLASNFIGGEKKIERRIERLYGLDDPHGRASAAER
jgi:cardiolipin synthase A/B